MVVLCCGRQCRVVTINGAPLATIEVDSNGDRFTAGAPVRAPEWCSDHAVVVTGHANGCVRIWRLAPLKLPGVKRYGPGWRSVAGGEGQQQLTLD
eukprot:CAMPEP_0169473528 /NCGR_PEP_ID=MMETSP1042-20121227/25758_1 /TAXON_ID=464988 /ORGANISM="Hemiselmis andersenii, Strain CCMP1180" /LENGTH=94 /DNA_ID=CAMNT_0009587471 /DNA_START=29 /DNA_END=310 /DNA_ORIENTATION=-